MAGEPARSSTRERTGRDVRMDDKSTVTKRGALRGAYGPAFGDRSLDGVAVRRARCDGFVNRHTVRAERVTRAPRHGS